jgi:O-methyltransferase
MNSSIAYTPSRLAIATRAFFSWLDKLFPSRMVKGLFDFSFGCYRLMIRVFYLRFWLVALLNGDRARRNKVATVSKVMPYSLVGWRGLEATYDAVVATRESGIEGSIVECGVARGGSAALMALNEAAAGSRRELWLFDSYEGLPEPTADDLRDNATGQHVRPLPKGSCLGTFDEVAKLLFETLALDRKNIQMVKGWFDSTLPVMRDDVGSISVLRIDADWYESVRCCLDNLYDQVRTGGYVIIDDYGSCFGAQKAVDELLLQRGLAVELFSDGRGGCHFVKP